MTRTGYLYDPTVGLYLSHEPGSATLGYRPTPSTADDSWERLVFAPLNKQWTAQFSASRQYLCMEDTRRLALRATVGVWEVFMATEQPTPNPNVWEPIFLYRLQAGRTVGSPLQIVETP